ncbi:unnamed protein product [Mycena citricolor]|uniref:Uncharacterized protein n=1 Tax=Mycena citricolor TaxID=2018698 RepID=A0AAD2H260_9AGAR|nr:unnamed protein product [Mycena citricolor]
MPRRKTQTSGNKHTSVKHCKYCDRTLPGSGFRLHEQFCKRQWDKAQFRKGHLTSAIIETDTTDLTGNASTLPGLPGSAISDLPPMFAPSPEFAPEAMDVDEAFSAQLDSNLPRLPLAYIDFIPHPKDVGASREITSLCDPSPSYHANPSPRSLLDAASPFAPWRTLSDFEYTETAVKGVSSANIVDAQLKGMTGRWSKQDSDITLRNFREFRRTLTDAHVHGVEFQSKTIKSTLWDKEYAYTFQYRDPWEWMLSLFTDPSLASVSQWKSKSVFYCENGVREKLVNEPWTADMWKMVDDELPLPDPNPHCWAPIHIWLDKGLVTKHVKMFPIVGRPMWLPSDIRNASGNGGGVILGFMVMVDDPGSSDERSADKNYEFAQFKREIYQTVLDTMFYSLYRRSCNGSPVTCGDSILRILYPGFHTESLDFEEAWNFTACRSNRANFPCPRCLIPQELLGRLTGDAVHMVPPRTSQSMRHVVDLSRRARTAGEREKILKDHGLHNIVHFMWNFRFCDPYLAVAYDLLHFDESGKWGHHGWKLVLEVLGQLKLSTDATDRMARFPRWRGLKHINDLTTKDFTDGQTHLDILKCIVFILAEILPAGSSLVAFARSLLQFRIVMGMKVITESRKALIARFIARYERACKAVSKEYEKNFNFPKQHFVVHAIEDIELKGVPRNATTRTGEGMHQEVAQHFHQTNMRNAEAQIAKRDEDQEAVARTRLLVDDFIRQQNPLPDDTDELYDLCKAGTQRKAPKSKIAPTNLDSHWIFGAPWDYGDSRALTGRKNTENDELFRNFDVQLRQFLADEFPEMYMSAELSFKASRCSTIEF